MRSKRAFSAYPPAGGNQPRGSRQTADQIRDALKKRALELQAMFEGDSRHDWLTEYRQALNACVDAGRQIWKLRPEYKHQSLVLEAYYQKDKLLDYLQQLVDFAEAELRPTDTVEKLAVKGYSNYLFVIKCTFEGLQQRYEQFSPEEPAEELRTRDVLKQECGGQPILEQWQQLRKPLADAIHDPQVDRQVCIRLMSELDVLELTFKREVAEMTAFLSRKEQSLRQRQESMLSEIRDGKDLYRALLWLLPQELFVRFDPDEAEERCESAQQVKEEYRLLAARARKVLAAYPR